MTKFFKLSAICMLAVCSLSVGCGEGEKKPMDKPEATTEADTPVTTPADGSGSTD